MERAQAQYWKTRTVHLQSTLVLQQVYCKRVRLQLKAKEAKGGKRSNQKLKNPHLGRVITDDEFYDEVRKQREADEEAARKKAQKRSAAERYAEAVAVWKDEDAKRVEENEKRKVALEVAKVGWKDGKDKAKAAKIKVKDWKIMNPEPKRTDPAFSIIPKPPKPTLDQFLDDEEDEGNWEDDEGSVNDEEGSDGDEIEDA